jgi:UDP-N-acetylmuramoyl-tripeptide--D-alanyl-D-alanine ligase
MIINADDEILMARARALGRELITFGVRNDAHFYPTVVEHDDSAVIVTMDGVRFRLPLFGSYQVYNLLAAYALARTLGYDFAQVDTMAIELATSDMRGQTVTRSGITFVADCYNANPESVRVGLQSFAEMDVAGRKVVILGDMLELGVEEVSYHKEMGRQLAAIEFDRAIFVGPLSRYAIDSAVEAGADEDKLTHFESADECAKEIEQILKPGDLVYLKASRGIGLENVLNRFAEEDN